MTKEVLLATHNAHKKAEIKDIFEGYDIKVITLDDLNYTGDMPIEDGKDFDENAYIKAKYFYDYYLMPTIADDSGLCIEHLRGLPGVHSARFIPSLNQDERNELICSIMRDVPNKKASFYCTMCYIDDEGEQFSTGIMDGIIAEKPRGTNGFGYDAIFIPRCEEYILPAQIDNRTLAEMDAEDKNAMSHRSLAICGLGEVLGFDDYFE